METKLLSFEDKKEYEFLIGLFYSEIMNSEMAYTVGNIDTTEKCFDKISNKDIGKITIDELDTLKGHLSLSTIIQICLNNISYLSSDNNKLSKRWLTYLGFNDNWKFK